MAKKHNYFLIAFAIPILISLTFYHFSAQPYSGTFVLNRPLSQPITIERDEYGVPRIKAANFNDALYGLGFVHAQDRLWNMYLRRLLSRGRLSEIFGRDALEIDKAARSLNLVRICEENMKHLPKDILEFAQSYVDGINDYVDTLRLLPFEFYLVGAKYEKFTPLDVVILQKLLAFAMTFDWSYEVLRERLAEVVGRKWSDLIIPHKMEHMYGRKSVVLNDEDLKQAGLYKEFNYSAEFPYDLTDDKYSDVNITYKEGPQEADPKMHLSFYDMLIPDLPKGSNAWVISGNLTATGKPILVNDPHLDNNMPSYWYQAALDCGEHSISGLSFPGLPMIAIGRTKYIAWGFTALYADVGDMYNETISPDNTKYLFEGKWYDLEQYDEKIYIKGEKEPFLYKVSVTRHGPILDSAFDEMHVGRGGPKYTHHNYSFAWVGYTKNDTSLKALFAFGFAKNTTEIFKAMEGIIVPPHNVHFATEDGDIGWAAMGRIPLRRDMRKGAYVKDGTKKENEWIGFIPWSEHPKIVNPKKGYIHSANNKIATDNYVSRASLNMWTIPRADRIEEILENYKKTGHKITVDDMKQMLLDDIDVFARDITPAILDLFQRYWGEFSSELSQYNTSKIYKELKISPFEHPKNRKTKPLKVVEIIKSKTISPKPVPSIDDVLNQLRNWNGSHHKDSVPAAIFNVWEYFFFMKALRGVGLNEHERQAVISNIVFEHFIFNKIESWQKNSSSDFDEFWCKEAESVNTTKTCLYNLIVSFYEARDYLYDELGSDIKTWRWGRIHRQHYKNIPFSETPLKPIWHRSYEAGGNTRTISVASRYIEQHNFDGVHGSNMRMICDMSQHDHVLAILDTGVSDRVMSKHYQDQMELYKEGKFIEVPLPGSKKPYVNKITINSK